ncbi:MAG: hypothetical protein EOM68_23115, partial [Spirochaetia bacterium]|nr:hypothetical protein [Spirochaetia bacterium]
MGQEDIAHHLHITPKVLTRVGINLLEVNHEYGYHVGMLKALKAGKSKDQYLQGRQEKRHRECLREQGLLPSQTGTTKEEIDRLHCGIVAYLKGTGYAVPIRNILDHFHIDYYCTWKKWGFTMDALLKEAGISKPSQKSSYWERETGKALKASFSVVREQARFAGCCSIETGYPLRFDFYLPAVNTLIEVDGQQHYDKGHYYWTSKAEKRDRIKDAYAKASGKTLIRVPVCPVATFYDRLDAIIKNVMGVLKPVELLDRSSTQSATKPVSNPEGSE